MFGYNSRARQETWTDKPLTKFEFFIYEPTLWLNNIESDQLNS